MADKIRVCAPNQSQHDPSRNLILSASAIIWHLSAFAIHSALAFAFIDGVFDYILSGALHFGLLVVFSGARKDTIHTKAQSGFLGGRMDTRCMIMTKWEWSFRYGCGDFVLDKIRMQDGCKAFRSVSCFL